MTQQEALEEARKRADRWGGFKHNAIAYTKSTRPYCVVGLIGKVFGEGNSFTAAFADADRRANEGKRGSPLSPTLPV